MAKKKSTIRKVVETVEGWVGMGSDAPAKKKAKTAKKSPGNIPRGAAGKRKKATKKTKKKSAKKS